MNVLKLKIPKLASYNWIGVTTIFISGILISIGTFPENDWTFETGIDPSLVWVFNHLFTTGLSDGISIIFPHGPLAFFMYPLPENALLVNLVTMILKVLLFWNVLSLIKSNDTKYSFIFSFIVSYFLAIISNFNHLILVNILLLNCNYFSTGRNLFKYVSFALFVFAFYVKSYVAILSGAITAVSLLYFFVSSRNVKLLIIEIVAIFASLMLFWLIMFGTFKGYFTYLYGIMNLAQDNSSAASIYQDNNWWFLVLFFIFTMLTFVNKEKRSLFFGLLAFFCLFAVWKHGMARQDTHHVNGMTSFVIIVFTVYNLFSQTNRIKNLVFSVLAIFALTFNNQNALYYQTPSVIINKSNNFIEFVSQYNLLQEKNNEISNKLIAKNKLSDSVLNIIGQSNVDVYPWDYSIIAANNLKWKPRVVIQSYAAYTGWLDKQNAEYIASDKSAEFIIWHSVDISFGMNGGTLNSIDFRYLLNDEPQTIVELIRCYKTVYSDQNVILLQKRETKLEVETSVSEKADYTWNQWIDVPDYEAGSLQRAKLQFDKSFAQSLKSFTFRDEQFWILMELSSGEIHKYRIVPKNAVYGLWLNPYSLTFDKVGTVKRIMFISSNPKILTKKLDICWENIVYKDVTDYPKFYNPGMADTCLPLYKEKVTFENNNFIGDEWSYYDRKLLCSQAFSGHKAFVLKPKCFSPSFSCQLDSLTQGWYIFSAGCWALSNDNNDTKNIAFVISVDYPDGQNNWKGEVFKRQIVNKNNWNYIRNFLILQNSHKGGVLKVYVWNNSQQDIIIDDVGVVIKKY
ncbi:MAG: hypothetical protein PHE56_11695 [Bacteroidales bacterium]|nr:hypothetical protein [Bacteroidales bacterium]